MPYFSKGIFVTERKYKNMIDDKQYERKKKENTHFLNKLIHWIIEIYKKYREIIMYIIFGVLTTLVRWITQWIFSGLFEAILPKRELNLLFLHYDSTAVFVATLLSWLAAVLFAYVTNKLWVFESKSWKPRIAVREFWQFFLSRFITGIIEIGGIYLLVGVGVDMLVISKSSMDATVIMSAIIMVLNYVFSKLIVFNTKH